MKSSFVSPEYWLFLSARLNRIKLRDGEVGTAGNYDSRLIWMYLNKGNEQYCHCFPSHRR